MKTAPALHELRVAENLSALCTCGNWTNPAFELASYYNEGIIFDYQQHINRVKGSVPAEEFTMWAPRLYDFSWLRRTLFSLKNGGSWVIPSCGAVLVVNHETKYLTPSCDTGNDPILLERTKTVARMCGWKIGVSSSSDTEMLDWLAERCFLPGDFDPKKVCVIVPEEFAALGDFDLACKNDRAALRRAIARAMQQ